MLQAQPNQEPLRVAELMTALPLPTDLGTGLAMGRAVRSSVPDARLGEGLGLSADAQVPVYHLYAKIGVSTHAGATAPARQYDLVGDCAQA